MARIGRIILPALSFVPLDGSANNLPPQLDLVQSSGGPPGPRYPRWTLGITQTESLCSTFRLPDDYVADMVFKFDWFTAETTGNAFFAAFVAAISNGDVTTLLTKAYASGVAGIVAVDGTANRLVQDTVSLGEDDAVAGDLVLMGFERRGAHASDTCEGAVHFLGGILEYASST